MIKQLNSDNVDKIILNVDNAFDCFSDQAMIVFKSDLLKNKKQTKKNSYN